MPEFDALSDISESINGILTNSGIPEVNIEETIKRMDQQAKVKDSKMKEMKWMKILLVKVIKNTFKHNQSNVDIFMIW